MNAEPIRRRVLLERNIWQGSTSGLPYWLEVLRAVVAAVFRRKPSRYAERMRLSR